MNELDGPPGPYRRPTVYMIRDTFQPPRALFRLSAAGEHVYRNSSGWEPMILLGSGLLGNPDFDDISEVEARQLFPGAFDTL